MEGFDVVLLGNFYALPQFQQAYGDLQPGGGYQISATWQAGLSNGANVGEIIGLCINGWASERFGYKKTMIAAVSVITVRIPAFTYISWCVACRYDRFHLHPLLLSQHSNSSRRRDSPGVSDS